MVAIQESDSLGFDVNMLSMSDLESQVHNQALLEQAVNVPVIKSLDSIENFLGHLKSG
jgi:hypothetical protein